LKVVGTIGDRLERAKWRQSGIDPAQTLPGKTLSHRTLLVQVWGPEYGSELEYLRIHLSHLRRKIEPNPVHPQYIHTVPRIGYKFR
jgi:DNA-binding response OmpR family regulator